MAFIQKRLLQCIDGHETCRGSIDMSDSAAKRPSRLLLVREDGGDIMVNVTDQIPSSVEYLTLSHCWGPSISCMLQTSNMTLYSERIPPNNLAKTFKEALELTVKLGFSYLWIDALCIVQDSYVDW